jgi:hypothetical protein
MSVTLHISGFHVKTRARDLAQVLETVGQLKSLELPIPKKPSNGGPLQPIAFAQYRDPKNTSVAIRKLDNALVQGQRIYITYARGRSNHQHRYRSPTRKYGSSYHPDELNQQNDHTRHFRRDRKPHPYKRIEYDRNDRNYRRHHQNTFLDSRSPMRTQHRRPRERSPKPIESNHEKVEHEKPANPHRELKECIKLKELDELDELDLDLDLDFDIV